VKQSKELVEEIKNLVNIKQPHPTPPQPPSRQTQRPLLQLNFKKCMYFESECKSQYLRPGTFFIPLQDSHPFLIFRKWQNR